MKKIAPIAVALLLVAGMTSCKKDYTCKCTSTVNGVTTVTSGGTIKETKKKATDACNKLDVNQTIAGVTTKTDCSIE